MENHFIKFYPEKWLFGDNFRIVDQEPGFLVRVFLLGRIVIHNFL